MSGIVGYLAPGSRQEVEIVARRMSERMRHRPWIQTQVEAEDDGVAFGRINIGILNRAPQPARSPDGQICLWLCGELYHQAQLRAELVRAGRLRLQAEDAELALAIFLRDGGSGLTRLDGAFLAAVWDGRNRQLTLVNDRFGLYPHYYTKLPRGFAFAPELKGLLAIDGVSRQLDACALAEYVRFQQHLGEKTWFDSIRLLPAASRVCYEPDRDRLDMTTYWDWDTIELQPSIAFEEAVEEASRLFQRAIDAMVTPPLRTGVFLSGGLDGRAILGFLEGQDQATTITFGTQECRDVVYAAELARRAGSTHHWFPLRDGRWVREHASLHLALTEGMHSWIHAHGMNTLGRARELIDVNLCGWDGGTTLGGYLDDYVSDRLYRHAPSELDLTQRLYDAFCQRLTWPGLTEAEEATLFGPNFRHLRGLAFDSFRAELARTSHYAPDRRADWFYIRQRVLRSTVNMVVFTRSAIEVRCPFFDYDFLTFLYSLPEQIRATPALQRAVITRRAPHLARVPCDRDDRLPHANPLIRQPHAAIQRVKAVVNRRIAPIFPTRPRLYADYEQYLRADLRAWAESILFAPRTESRGLFDSSTVQALWNRHLSGTELWTIGKIAPLMTIELVLRTLYEGDDAPGADLAPGATGQLLSGTANA
jgi:asparagine synthase (glutamine-hydrolysing)